MNGRVVVRLVAICAFCAAAVAVALVVMAVHHPSSGSGATQTQDVTLLPAVDKSTLSISDADLRGALKDQGVAVVPAKTISPRFDVVDRKVIAAYRVKGASRVLIIVWNHPAADAASLVTQLPVGCASNESIGNIYIECEDRLPSEAALPLRHAFAALVDSALQVTK
jgi:hypothetical protein